MATLLSKMETADAAWLVFYCLSVETFLIFGWPSISGSFDNFFEAKEASLFPSGALFNWALRLTVLGMLLCYAAGATRVLD